MASETTKKTTADKQSNPVLVTTEFRGVFFGYEVARTIDNHGNLSVTIERARCAIYWGTTKGFLELAATGPTRTSKIGARAPGRLELRKVTSISDCSHEAVEAWEAVA